MEERNSDTERGQQDEILQCQCVAGEIGINHGTHFNFNDLQISRQPEH